MQILQIKQQTIFTVQSLKFILINKQYALQVAQIK